MEKREQKKEVGKELGNEERKVVKKERGIKGKRKEGIQKLKNDTCGKKKKEKEKKNVCTIMEIQRIS